MYLGDIRTGKVIRFTFTTVSAGVPTTLAGTPAVAVYKDGGTTESTTGVTLTVDFDARTGLNHVAVDTSADGTFYSADSNFSVVVTAGTVGGSSLVGYTVASFSIEARQADANLTRSLGTAVTNEDGTAQAGGTSTITLAASASSVNDYYTGQVVETLAGTGGGQKRVIVGYVGATRVATVHRAWATNPDSTTTYNLLPGEADAATLSLDKTAADNLEAAYDGTGYAHTANTYPWTAAWDAEVQSEVADALAAYDPPTHAELTAELATADDATLAAIAALNNLSAAQVNAEVDAAIETYHLHRLFAAAYDPASEPGNASALLNVLVENDAGVPRFTANALEQGPAGGGGGTADWTADERTAIRTILGVPASGTTPEAPAAGALKVIDDFLDTEVADIRTRVLLALPAAAPGGADGLHVLGTNAAAVAYTAGVTFSNATGHGLYLSSSGGDPGYGLCVESVSAGVVVMAGGDALTLTAGGNGSGVLATGSGTGNGVTAAGGATGDDLHLTNSEATTLRDAVLTADAITAAVIATGAIDADALAADAVSEIWTTALTEAYRSAGATGTAAQLLYEIIAHLGESAISGTTKTLKKLDGSTTAKTYTLDSATTPTSITEAT